MEEKGSLVFKVEAPINKTWEFLSNILKVGSCVPGVTEIDLIDPETKLSRWVYKVKVGFITKTFKIITRMIREDPPFVAEFEGHSEDGLLRMKGSIKNQPDGEYATRVCYELVGRAGEAIPASLRSLLETLMKERAHKEAEQFAANVKARIELEKDIPKN